MLASDLETCELVKSVRQNVVQPLQFKQEESSSGLNDLPQKLLRRIVSFVSLKERLTKLRRVNKKWRQLIDESVRQITLYDDPFIGSSDDCIKMFFHEYGERLEYINFDMFRTDKNVSQWSWRQLVTRIVHLCPNLTKIDFLFCARHKLRDKDVIDIFSHCFKLAEFRADAQFLTGHCLSHAPVGLRVLELERCVRLIDSSILAVTHRAGRLRVLHLSQIVNLSDAAIEAVSSRCSLLEELSLVSLPLVDRTAVTSRGLLKLTRLTNLRILCLEGLPTVTDNLLKSLSYSKSLSEKLEGLSLAYCFNVSKNGVSNLTNLHKLKWINLDGVSCRDISDGLAVVASKGRLEKILACEMAYVLPKALLNVVKMSPRLCMLDICNNYLAMDWTTAEQLIAFFVNSSEARCPLTILSDQIEICWSHHASLPHSSLYVKPPVQIVDVNCHQSTTAKNGLYSRDGPLQLPTGILARQLRRGNRYRLMSIHPFNNPFPFSDIPQNPFNGWSEYVQRLRVACHSLLKGMNWVM